MASQAAREGTLDNREIRENPLQQQVQPIQNHAEANQSVVNQSSVACRGKATHIEAQHSDASMQQQLIAIWREVLGCEVSANDNFFDLGGNSLYAMRILSELKKRNSPTFSTRELYMHQTISRLTGASVN